MCVPGCEEAVRHALTRRGFFQGTGAIAAGFANGDTITVNSQTLTFVTSGAVGNNQINIGDTIATLLGKIDLGGRRGFPPSASPARRQRSSSEPRSMNSMEKK